MFYVLKYPFRSVFQNILERMRTDNRHLRTWPHKLHCSYKDYWNKDSVFRGKKNMVLTCKR